MIVTVSPTQSQVEQALRAFLLAILPSGVEVVEGQDNRVAEPSAPDFIVYWPLRSDRLSTNVGSLNDATYTGSIAGTTLSISAVVSGTPNLAVGSPIYSQDTAPGTVITALGTGTGGVGSYTVSNSQTVPSELMASGGKSFLQAVHFTFQIDVHGPNSETNSVAISTLGRDQFAVDQFSLSGFDVTPLYFDDPKQMPFINSEQQYENRWLIEANLQVNQVVTGIPQQFASNLIINTVEVDTAYH